MSVSIQDTSKHAFAARLGSSRRGKAHSIHKQASAQQAISAWAYVMCSTKRINKPRLQLVSMLPDATINVSTRQGTWEVWACGHWMIAACGVEMHGEVACRHDLADAT